jgi:hypothetical protein
MDSCRVGAPSGVMVASMVYPVRGFVSVYRPGDGLVKMVEVSSGECAQGDISRLCQEVGVRGDLGTTRPRV